PVLVANAGTSDFPLVEQFARETECPSLESGLSSRFRSCCTALVPDLARQVVSVYERHRQEKGSSAIASNYSEALPYITKIDRNRQATYRRKIGERRAETNGEPVTLNGHGTLARSLCRSSRRRQWQGRTKGCT